MSDYLTKYKLPQKWVWTSLNEIIGKTTTYQKVQKKYYSLKGVLPIVDQGQQFIGGYTNDLSFKVQCSLPVVVFGDHTKNIKFVDFAFAGGADGIKIIQPFPSLNPRMLLYFLMSLKELIPDRGYSRHFHLIENLRFPLPPLLEQGRIVVKIDNLLKIIEKGEEHLKNAQYQLKLYRESILQKAFTGQLSEQWRNDNQFQHANEITELIKIERQKYYQDLLENWEDAVSHWKNNDRKGRKPIKPRALKNYSRFTDEQIGELPELPESWTWIKLGQISEIVGGVTKGRKLTGRKTVTIPYLRVANVQDGYLDLNEVKQIEVLPEDVTKYSLESGDILYIEGGDKDKLGRGTIWNNELPSCIHQNHVFRARMINRKVNIPEFIAYNSQTQVAKGYFFHNAKQTVNLASINMTVLSELPVPLCSMEEQQEIIDQLEKLFTKQEELNQTIDFALKDTQTLRQSILKKAFEGKLVPQDSNDEPASELLKKIQKEKQKWQESQKAKKKISKPKTRMEALTIEQVFKQAKKPLSSKELWETSKHKHDIEEFYLELKKLGDKVVDVGNETESLLRLEDAN